MKPFVRFHMRLPVKVRRKDKWFYSSCPILDVHSQGLSRDQAIANLKEAIQLFVESCFQRGTLAQVLRDSGFIPGDEDQSEVLQKNYIDIPMSLIARNHAEACAH